MVLVIFDISSLLWSENQKSKVIRIFYIDYEYFYFSHLNFGVREFRTMKQLNIINNAMILLVSLFHSFF